MSLYYVQKFLDELNRDRKLQEAYLADRLAVLEPYDLDEEEVVALIEPDVGLLYIFGVIGQIRMHFAALHQIEWADYLQRTRDRVAEHGPVRAGVHARARRAFRPSSGELAVWAAASRRTCARLDAGALRHPQVAAPGPARHPYRRGLRRSRAVRPARPHRRPARGPGWASPPQR
ncbi:MAG: hypothetical protein F4110_01760 [Acidimicrobiaceae bacterium]|nr:hypothetical protein [Acidimicrobiaceae bacterium]MYI52710.1 hypothetical protein [Acidimicrobiaceae bacterium]